MALETPNTIEASGTFDGFDPATNPIIRSNGIQQFDPATTPAAPLGGFTRIGAGSYLIRVIQAISFLEVIVLLTCLPSKNPGQLCALVFDEDSVTPPGSVGDIFVAASGGFDQNFYMGVFRQQTGGEANPTA